MLLFYKSHCIKSIIVGEDIFVDSNNETSTYKLSCVVCFKCFLLVGVCYINYGGFQTTVYKIGSCYRVRMTRK
jgi:hypothetical protein